MAVPERVGHDDRVEFPARSGRRGPAEHDGSVVVYGSVNWDDVYVLPRYPGAHEKLDASSHHQGLGGAGANTATWLASGLPVKFVGAVGADAEADLCLEALRAAGVGVDFAERVAEAATGRACSWTTGADKRIVRVRDRHLTRAHERPDTLAMVSRARHLHLASHVDGAGLQCVEAARAGGATISVELSGNTHDAAREVADLVFLNAEELRTGFSLNADALEASAAAAVAPKPGATLVVTAGAEAIHVATADAVSRFGVSPLRDVVDRTGGGDAFDAGFLAAWLQGAALADAITAGQALSARALSQVGAARRQ